MMLACLTRLLQRTAQFMDTGAFLGYYGCYASALLGGRHAIERNLLYANAIRESARVNGFSQLRVFQAALSAFRGSPRATTRMRDATITLDKPRTQSHLSPCY